MFQSGANTEKSAFEFAIEQVNRDSKILPNITLIPVVENINDIFTSSRKGLCTCSVSDYVTQAFT